MSESPRIIFLTPSLIMVNTHLILTAVHWTKMFGLHLMENEIWESAVLPALT